MKRSTQPALTKNAPLTARNVLYKIKAFMGSSWARGLVLGLFVVQTVVLVFTMRIGTPPDETNHVQFIEYYAHHSISPWFHNQQPTFNLGDKTREVDYLYHYTMSLLYRILPLSTHGKYMVIRLFSVLFGLLCLLVLVKIFKRLGFSAATITTSLLVVTNLPMVLMMSSAINNDVFVWLGMALGILLLLRLWAKPSTIDLLWLADLSLIGGLVKRDLLPLGLIFGILGIIIFARNSRLLVAGLKKFDWHIAAALAVLLVGIVLFTERVGGNITRYGSVVVTCEQVDGKAACYNFWGNVRARNLANQPPEKQVTPAIFVVRWFGESFSNITDIQTQGWRHKVKPARWLTTVLVYVMVVGLIYGVVYEKRRFVSDQISRHRVCVIAIALFYIFVQLVVNYSTYRQVKFFGIALNGRYIIASVLLLAGFACFYWTKLLARHPRLLAMLAIAIVLSTIFGSGLLMMLRNTQLYNG